MSQSKGTTLRASSSRPKRSTTNLADLRLAPLSTHFEPPRDRHVTTGAKNPYAESPDFARHHPSYLQGKSAPSTPGILSRSSSRRHLAGGLGRRESLYDEVDEAGTYEYSPSAARPPGAARAEVGSGKIPKAKSEAALLVQQRRQGQQQQQTSHVSGQGGSAKKRHHHRRRTGEGNASRVKSRTKAAEDDWLTRTGAATNALLQESKGQSWLASRASSASIAAMVDTTDDDEDEGYEEMAALSAMTVRVGPTPDALSPVGTRGSRWGSRYGSRPTSKMTSRRGSTTGSRTPLASAMGLEAMTSYFDAPASSFDQEAVDDATESESADEEEVARLATVEQAYGLGGVVDRLMNFSLFKVEERNESSAEEEAEPAAETESEAKARMAAVNKRKREEKERLVALQPVVDENEAAEQADVGWRDAAWLLSVATRAMFSDSSS